MIETPIFAAVIMGHYYKTNAFAYRGRKGFWIKDIFNGFINRFTDTKYFFTLTLRYIKYNFGLPTTKTYL